MEYTRNLYENNQILNASMEQAEFAAAAAQAEILPLGIKHYIPETFKGEMNDKPSLTLYTNMNHILDLCLYLTGVCRHFLH